jgi:hypothetical protein
MGNRVIECYWVGTLLLPFPYYPRSLLLNHGLSATHGIAPGRW